MSIQRESGDPSLIDVLDRVLDKGIVIDSCVRVSLVGVDLVVEARVPIHIADVATSAEESPTLGTFGSATSSRSALLRDEGEADEE